MAMKRMKKNDLQFVDGYLCDKEGYVVAIDGDVVICANRLDTELQKKLYLDRQPKAQPMPSLDGFKREHLNEVKVPQIEVVDTPVTDKRVAEAMAFVKEMEDQNIANKVNKEAEEYAALFAFVMSDDVWVYTDVDGTYEFDTPFLGNPLDLTQEHVLTVIGYLHDATEIVADEEE